MTKALKFDQDKPGLDLLPTAAKKAIAEVFDFGAEKYARHNWRNGFEYSRLIRAALGHIEDFNDGEDNDRESGKSHLAHAGCCILMLLESVIKGYGTDNRYKAVQVVNVPNIFTPIGTATAQVSITVPSPDTDTFKSPLDINGTIFKTDTTKILQNDIKKVSNQMSELDKSAKFLEKMQTI